MQPYSIRDLAEDRAFVAALYGLALARGGVFLGTAAEVHAAIAAWGRRDPAMPTSGPHADHLLRAVAGRTFPGLPVTLRALPRHAGWAIEVKPDRFSHRVPPPPARAAQVAQAVAISAPPGGGGAVKGSDHVGHHGATVAAAPASTRRSIGVLYDWPHRPRLGSPFAL